MLARDRRAAAARRTLVAGHRDVLEVAAARALHQVAAGRGQVAQLARRAGQDRLGQRRIALADARVGGQIAVAHAGADADAAVLERLDPVERQPGDVDEQGR